MLLACSKQVAGVTDKLGFNEDLRSSAMLSLLLVFVRSFECMQLLVHATYCLVEEEVARLENGEMIVSSSTPRSSVGRGNEHDVTTSYIQYK